VLSIALGTGATIAIFSVVKAVVIDPLPYDQPQRVVALTEGTPGELPTRSVGAWVANEWRIRSRSFQSISLYGDGQRVLIENNQAEVLRGLRVSHDFFETLGVRLLLGRSFRPEDDGSPRNNDVILSYGLWMNRFGGDPNVIGRALDLSTETYRVIGVLPSGFYPLRMSNLAERPAIFMPLGYDPAQANACLNCFGGNAIGRLRPGIDIRPASAELNGVMREIVRDTPADFPRETAVVVEPLRGRVVGPIQSALWALMGAVVLVLLIVSANIANLLLARATGRAKEIAIRFALGCSGGRMAFQFLVESLLLSMAGGAGGMLLAWAGVAALKSLAPGELLAWTKCAPTLPFSFSRSESAC
jgi:predicted permease